MKKRWQGQEKMKGSIIKVVLEQGIVLLTPYDSSRGGEAFRGSGDHRLFSSRVAGLCKCVFWYVVAISVGLLLARLN